MTTTLATKLDADIRGFALYVGLSEDKLEGNTRLADLVAHIRELVADLAPEADTHATVALAPEGVGGRDIDVVRLALGDPSLKQATKRAADADSPAPHV